MNEAEYVRLVRAEAALLAQVKALQHQPATPLPWEAYRTKAPWRNAIMHDGHVFAELNGSDYRRDPTDAAYIAHACNAYPKLVAALQKSIAENYEGGPESARANELLRELGEGS